MAVEVSKKPGESSASLVRRFSRTVQQSGVLLRARKTRYFHKQKNKRKLRDSALRREQARQERERIQKMSPPSK